MRTFARAIPPLLLFALVGPSAHADEWKKTYPITGTPRVEVRTGDGEVEIATWDRASVGVRVTTEGWKIGSGGVKIIEGAQGSDVAVEVKEPMRIFSIDGHRRIRVEVLVPDRSDLDVTTGDGSVSIRPIEGDIRVHTGDGSVSIDGARGALSVHTGDGAIRAHDLEGSLIAATGDGSMQISGRFSELELGSGDGDISAEAEPAKPRGEWSIVTGDGSVVLQLPEDFKADLDVQTGDGRIELDLLVEVSGTYKRTMVHGTLNGGGPPLQLRSGDGSIRIAKL